MIIIEDKNNKDGKHFAKNKWFEENAIEVIRQRLPVGDYVLMNDKIENVFSRKNARGIPVKMMDLVGTYNICVDVKNSVQELVGDICGKSHDRFRDECILAQNNGIDLIVLVETEDGITHLSELHKWVNPRLFIRGRNGVQKYPKATRGVTLMKACYTIQKKYGTKFAFCHPNDSAKKIIEILGGNNETGTAE